jgi:hypothetical protein
MERVEGGRQWDTWQGVMGPADGLKAACDAAGSWLRVRPGFQWGRLLCSTLWAAYESAAGVVGCNEGENWCAHLQALHGCMNGVCSTVWC